MLRLRRRGVAVALVIGLLLMAALVRPYRVAGVSMAPHYQDGELVWTIPIWGAPKRGEVVIFEAPDGSGWSMKRVAGLPGEAPQNDFQRLRPDPSRPPVETHKAEWVFDPQRRSALPAGHFFLLGDHLVASIDSRDFGPVRSEALRRRVLGGSRGESRGGRW